MVSNLTFLKLLSIFRQVKNLLNALMLVSNVIEAIFFGNKYNLVYHAIEEGKVGSKVCNF